MNIFIYNPESGNGKLKKHEEYILKNLRAKYGEIECIRTTHAGHAEELAREYSTAEYIFVGGGDGTLNEVVNGLKEAEKKPIIGYIPCGTVNDVAHSLGLSKNIKKAVKILVSGRPFNHDTFMVNDRAGIYVCCTGLFTSSSYATARRDKKLLGKVAYFFKGAKDIFTAKPFKVQLIAGEETLSASASLILVLNSRSTAGFMLNKNAALNDGEVEVLIFSCHEKRVTLGDILRCMKAFVLGVNSVKNSKKVIYKKLSDFSLKMGEGAIINLDGEKSGRGSFNFSVKREGAQLLISEKTFKKLEKLSIKD